MIATGSWIPLEVYEVWQTADPVRVAILAINVAIVAYLITGSSAAREKAGAAAAPAAAVT